MVEVPWQRLIDPVPDREYLALATELPVRSLRGSFQILRLARPVIQQLASAPGLVGYSMRARILGKRFHTLSVWVDEAALEAFTRASPHRETMAALAGKVRDARFVRWTLRGTEVPPRWENALGRLVGTQ